MRYIFALWTPNGQAPNWSNEYSPEWGDKLARSIRRHSPKAEIVAVTDFPREAFKEDIECHEFLYSERSWSCMMELYRPEIVKDRAILVGLDTVAVGDLSDIEGAVEQTGACHILPLDPYRKPLVCNGVVGVNHDTSQTIWFTWAAGRARGDLDSSTYKMFGNFSEMVWLRHNSPPSALWDRVTPGQIESYKCSVRKREGLTEATRMVYFHGRPKPHQISDDWLKRNWK
jgi:hypothetical protein